MNNMENDEWKMTSDTILRKTMRIAARSLAFCTLILCLSALGVIAQQPSRGITPEDYYAFEFLSDPQISPDGKLIAYVVTRIDRAQNRRVTSIWMAAVDGSRAPWQFTTSPQSSNSPRWSPDGKWLAFLSSRPAESSSPSSPSGPTSAASPTPAAGPTPAPAAGAASGAAPADQTRSQVYVLSMSGGEARRITNLKNGVSTFRWAPDANRMVVVSRIGPSDTRPESRDRSDARHYRNSSYKFNDTGWFDDRRTHLWVVGVQSGSAKQITEGNDWNDSDPQWSPDGTRIAFVSNRTGKEYDENRNTDVWVIPAAGGALVKISDHDESDNSPRWAPDGKTIAFTGEVHDRDHPKIWVAPATGGVASVLVADLNGRNERKLTNLNEALWKRLQLADVERFTFKSAEDWDIDGFLVKPIGWQEGKKYALILSIHGGPAAMYGVDWFHEFQGYAAKGYAVLYTNPRGSTGYGQKFERGIVGEWGGKDYVDVMNGVDAALRKYSWIDADRLGVTGGSYGGYLTNWIVGHTDRFKAAVTLRSVTNFISDEGTRDGAYGHTPDFGGDLFEKFDLYWDRSPLKYAKNVKTPTLILHSDNDFRVPLEQGEQWFRALRHFGVTTEIVMFPRENHNLTRTGEPKHLVESLNWQLYWFDRFVLGNNDAVPPNQK
ncbi:MAG: S9 family peptidase [Pyrinomonadaceae bacterium]